LERITNRASDIKRIVDVVTKRENVEKYSRAVSRDEIRQNDYNLNIPRYVDSSEEAESWDIFASMFGGLPISEIDKLEDYWRAFPSLRNELFENTSSEYCRLTATDVKKAILEHSDVKRFQQQYASAFDDFDSYLYEELIGKMSELNISKTEATLSAEIFGRLSSIPLVDRYIAYQLLDDEWTKIAVDLEIIQTEGFEATKKVNPNMIVKKKDGKEQEVQEGWVGQIIPFDLIQTTILKEDKAVLEDKESRLTEIAAEYEELLDSLTEEEKEGDFVNESKDAFVAAEIKKALKSESIEPETKEKLRSVNSLIAEEKELKAAIKKEVGLLEAKTKETIEGLSDDQAIELLKDKWITPIINNLMKLPDGIVSDLVSKLDSLAKKYETTLEEVESEIDETEKALSSMIDELVGGEFDMLGLKEFQKLLGGVQND
jgi:type I restriction enzyme M protein